MSCLVLKDIATSIACENIRFSSLFAAGNVSRGGNVPSGEERGEMDVSAGYDISGIVTTSILSFFLVLRVTRMTTRLTKVESMENFKKAFAKFAFVRPHPLLEFVWHKGRIFELSWATVD